MVQRISKSIESILERVQGLVDRLLAVRAIVESSIVLAAQTGAWRMVAWFAGLVDSGSGRLASNPDVRWRTRARSHGGKIAGLCLPQRR